MLLMFLLNENQGSYKAHANEMVQYVKHLLGTLVKVEQNKHKFVNVLHQGRSDA